MKELALTALGAVAAVFGGWAIYRGHDGNVVTGVLTFLGIIGGYIAGKKASGE